jgi:hypothetical protein
MPDPEGGVLNATLRCEHGAVTIVVWTFTETDGVSSSVGHRPGDALDPSGVDPQPIVHTERAKRRPGNDIGLTSFELGTYRPRSASRGLR